MFTPRHLIRNSLLAALIAVSMTAHAQVPQIINYQSRVAVGGANFDGSGQFKFALVNADGSATYWSNDGTSAAGSQPTAAVTLAVNKGLYSVQLGDTALANMTAIPASVFTNADVRLRVWFNDGVNGSQLLSPDHRIAAVGYAIMADTASAANGLKTTGADVVVSTATPPTPGQVLTATSATAASWQSGSLPKCDRQFVSANVFTVNGSNFSDITGLTLTTHDLGEPGTYLIVFNTFAFSASSGNEFIVNINGNDVAESLTTTGGAASARGTMSINYVATNVPAGSIIKVRVRSTTSSPTGCVTPKLTIDGLPSTYVK